MDGNLTKKNNLSILNLSPGGFGAEPGQVQHGSGEGSGEAASGQVIPKIPGEGLGGFGAKPSQARQTGEGSGEVLVQSQVKFNGFRRRPGRLWCTARSGSTGFQRRFRKRSNLTWPCTKASQTSGIFRNHVELDLALHQSLRNLLRNLLWNPVGPDLALHQGFSGPSPEPSREPSELSPEPR